MGVLKSLKNASQSNHVYCNPHPQKKFAHFLNFFLFVTILYMSTNI